MPTYGARNGSMRRHLSDDGRRGQRLCLLEMFLLEVVCVSYLRLIIVWPRVLFTGGRGGVEVA